MSIKNVILFFVSLVFVLGLMGCGNKDPIIESIHIDLDQIDETYDPDLFDLSSIALVVTMDDGTTFSVPLDETMISENDRALLSTLGTHQIAISYQGFSTTLTLTMGYDALKTTLHLIYAMALETMEIPQTYEDWLDSIKGEDGRSIISASINPSGHLILTFSDQETLDVGLIVGSDGREIEIDVVSDDLVWRYQGDVTWQILIEKEAYHGIGIQSIDIDTYGDLIVTLTDDEVINLGMIKGHLVMFLGMHGDVLQVSWVRHGDAVTAPDTPTVEGHIFSMWDQALDPIESDLIIHALYDPMLFDVTFVTDGGNPVPEIHDVPYGETIILPVPSKEGYVFDGWYMGVTPFSAPFYDNTPVYDHLTLYARYVKATYNVYFVDKEGYLVSAQIVTHGKSAIEPIAPHIPGFRFDGWDQAFVSIDSDLLITPIYTPVTFTITFLPLIDVEIPIMSGLTFGDVIDLPLPVREDYDFLGWYDGGTVVDMSFSMPDRDVLLVAQWEKHVYTLSFDVNTGTMTEPSSFGHYRNDTIETLPEPTKEGFDFLGWFDDDIEVTAPFVWDYAEDIHLVAYWQGIVNLVEYRIVNEEVWVIGSGYDILNLVIPDTLSGLPVTTIIDQAFMMHTTLMTVTLGDHVHTVGTQAFAACDNLTSVNLGPHTTTLGFDVFTGSNQMIHLNVSSEAQYELRYYFGFDFMNIPITLQTIGFVSGSDFIDPTIYSNEMLGKTLVLPEDMTVIPKDQFKDAIYLKNIELPQGLLTIGEAAFKNSGLISVTIPNTVTSIENYAFNNADYLVSLNFEADSTLQTIGMEAFRGSEISGALTIPASVSSIGSLAFGSTKLTHIDFEPGSLLTSIPGHGFSNITTLISFDIPATVHTIGNYAFSNNGSLETIIIPISVTTMGMNVFSMCGTLTIYAEAFEQPPGWEPSFNPNNRPIYWSYEGLFTSGDFDYMLFSDNEAILLNRTSGSVTTDLIIPALISDHQVIEIADEAFDGDILTSSISIPYTVRRIGKFAFRGNTALTIVTFETGSTLRSIDLHAFYNATSLSTIVLPDQLLTIGALAFHNVDITSMVIPASVTSIGNGAFEFCSLLTSLTFETGSQLQTIGQWVFYETPIEHLILPEGLTTIQNSAFKNMDSLMTIYIPDTVTSMGSDQFIDTPFVTIHAESPIQPSLWASDWNSTDRPVIWGYVI